MTSGNAFIACGSNIDPRANLPRALARLDGVVERLRTSPTYLTRPWGIAEQQPYLNLVVGIRTAAGPYALLDQLKAIERSLGRTRGVRYGPRPIDLDILLYDDLVVDDPRLTIPHPGLAERDFMLVPLLDIAPHLTHPADGAPLAHRRHGIRYRQIVCRVLP